MKRIFDFTELMIPGTGVFTTETLSIVSALIRGAEEGERNGLAEGVAAFANPKIPSHVFLVKDVSAGGNIRCSEFTWPYDPNTANRGCNEFNLTEEYGLNILGNHICGVFRHPALDDDEGLQVWSTAWMKAQHRKGMEYGIENLFADLGIGKINPEKYVCIQYWIAFHLALKTKAVPVLFPASWVLPDGKPNVVSLEEVSEWCLAAGWGRKWMKDAPDDYDPTKEIIGPAG